MSDKPRYATLRRYFIAGLLVWLPLGATVLIIKLVLDLMDRVLLLLPSNLRPEALFGFSIPGFGVVVSVVVVLITGMVVANIFGKRLVALWESLLHRIPLVSTIHRAVKQVAETLLADDTKSFRKTLLVEYPRKGVWSLGFLTTERLGEVQHRTHAEMVCVFIPTTPNPTSGFLLMVPRDEVIELDMSVDEAFRMIVSLGVVTPLWPRPVNGAVAPSTE